MPNEHILIVEDDKEIARVLRTYLEQAEFRISIAYDGHTAMSILAHERPDFIILDLMLPDKDGLDITRHIRSRPELRHIYILMLTARVEDMDKILGLEVGADDYVTKPFNPLELVARVQAMLRRAYPSQNGAEMLQFGPYVFETRPGRLLMDGSVIDVTHKEFYLALLFFRNIGRPLSRAYIHEAVWIRETEVPSRTMDTHVSRVRNKLQLKPENGFRLVPVYSYGYRLEKLGV